METLQTSVLCLFILSVFRIPSLNFGDSNTDTCAMALSRGLALHPPFGTKFRFEFPTTRWSDGRLYIHFLCERLMIPYLSPYLQPFGGEFSHGANFAYFGAVVMAEMDSIAFRLKVQFDQFTLFRNMSSLLRSQGKGSLIADEEFESVVYSIDIGQNDIFNFFINRTDYSIIVNNVIPRTLNSIQITVENLFGYGARKFLLYNTGSLGYLPNMLYMQGYNFGVDEFGCRSIFNNASKAFKKGLGVLCDYLKSKLKDVHNIVCLDMYSIKYDLFANGGKYVIMHPTVDQTHFTDATSEVVASKISSGAYSWPRDKLEDLCSLCAFYLNLLVM